MGNDHRKTARGGGTFRCTEDEELLKRIRKARAKLALDEDVRAAESIGVENIDTSDIPEVTDWSGAERGRFYRGNRS